MFLCMYLREELSPVRTVFFLIMCMLLNALISLRCSSMIGCLDVSDQPFWDSAAGQSWHHIPKDNGPHPQVLQTGQLHWLQQWVANFHPLRFFPSYKLALWKGQLHSHSRSRFKLVFAFFLSWRQWSCAGLFQRRIWPQICALPACFTRATMAYSSC